MKLYTIWTENKNVGAIEDKLMETLEGGTITMTYGVWEGEIENSLKIEIVTLDELDWKVRWFAGWIKTLNEQQTVMITTQPITREFV